MPIVRCIAPFVLPPMRSSRDCNPHRISVFRHKHDRFLWSSELRMRPISDADLVPFQHRLHQLQHTQFNSNPAHYSALHIHMWSWHPFKCSPAVWRTSTKHCMVRTANLANHTRKVLRSNGDHKTFTFYCGELCRQKVFTFYFHFFFHAE